MEEKCSIDQLDTSNSDTWKWQVAIYCYKRYLLNPGTGRDGAGRLLGRLLKHETGRLLKHETRRDGTGQTRPLLLNCTVSLPCHYCGSVAYSAKGKEERSRRTSQ